MSHRDLTINLRNQSYPKWEHHSKKKHCPSDGSISLMQLASSAWLSIFCISLSNSVQVLWVTIRYLTLQQLNPAIPETIWPVRGQSQDSKPGQLDANLCLFLIAVFLQYTNCQFTDNHGIGKLGIKYFKHYTDPHFTT